MSDTFVLIMQIIYISFCTLSLFQVKKKWREDKNKMYLIIILYIVLLVLVSLIYIMAIFTEFNTSIVIGGNLTVGLALAFFTNVIQVEFVLYLRKYNKFYTLPLIATLYIAFGLLLNSSTIIFEYELLFLSRLKYPIIHNLYQHLYFNSYDILSLKCKIHI